jgi:hypothetical protein
MPAFIGLPCSFRRCNHTIKMGVTKETVKSGEQRRPAHTREKQQQQTQQKQHFKQGKCSK